MKPHAIKDTDATESPPSPDGGNEGIVVDYEFFVDELEQEFNQHPDIDKDFFSIPPAQGG